MHVSLRESRGGSRIQTWNRYAYVANNPLNATDRWDSIGRLATVGILGPGGDRWRKLRWRDYGWLQE